MVLLKPMMTGGYIPIFLASPTIAAIALTSPPQHPASQGQAFHFRVDVHSTIFQTTTDPQMAQKKTDDRRANPPVYHYRNIMTLWINTYQFCI
jgi:hypothetical protein